MLTDQELRQAVFAIGVIETLGDRREWECILRQARDSTPSGEPWGNDPYGARLRADVLARRLSELLGVPRARCERAAQAVWATSRQRAVYDALLAYAAELTEMEGREPAPTDAPPARPPIAASLHLTLDTEAVA
jgi:hypothetical protein